MDNMPDSKSTEYMIMFYTIVRRFLRSRYQTPRLWKDLGGLLCLKIPHNPEAIYPTAIFTLSNLRGDLIISWHVAFEIY